MDMWPLEPANGKSWIGICNLPNYERSLSSDSLLKVDSSNQYLYIHWTLF
ncbi:hypothetical protein Lalb_Chr14g0367321 [Lupinus albus]|uniref:Uncharacterized protein n=1 Tax=Lupinus albus TaxID=3870 RepID=A0A6A4P9T5_LUPAL|nr:hypothetical protein Lalb_Chr14g0367321 [Lupinus albus]